MDITRNTITRVSLNPTVPASAPGWSPDGHSIAYSAGIPNGRLRLFVSAADGTGQEQNVAGFNDDRRDEWFTDWSSDGRYLLFFTVDPETQQDVWALPADGSGKPIPVAHGPHNEFNGRFSLDGQWVAYVSDESGRNEIYLVPFRHGQGKRQVSTQGANELIWARDGKTLYYISGQDEMWSVRVTARRDSVELGTPQRVFQIPIAIRMVLGSSFDVTRDGHFLINTLSGRGDEPMVLVQNWKALLNR